MSIVSLMSSPLKDLLTSKKFIVSALTTIGMITALFGLQLDPEAVALVLSPLLVFILGQGVADHGKEAAKINQDTTLKSMEVAERHQSRSSQSGFTRVQVMVTAAVFGAAVFLGAAVSACTNPVHSTLRFGQCVLDEGVLGEVLVALDKPDYIKLLKEVGVRHTIGIVQCALTAVASQEDEAPATPRLMAPTDSRSSRARHALKELGRE